MRGAAQTSDPTVQYLYQLLDAIGEGRLLIPRFQRPLVWKWDRQSELLRSVKEGIPIGAVMVWRTTTDRVAWRTELGSHSLRAPDPGFPRDYLLDGLQRLSTLFAALREYFDFGEDPAPIGYDLEEEIFVEAYDGATLPQVLPLRLIGDSVALLRFQRTLKGARADAWVARADQLARAFREYKIPVISIVSDDFELVARTFNLINTQGIRMGEADMIHALSWQPGFELRDQLEALRSEVLQPLGWGSIDFETVLRVVKAGADLDLYEESVEQVSDRLKQDRQVLTRAFEHLARAANVLREECRILSWELVPYALQAVLMADACRAAGAQDVSALLADWFWLTTYGEMFTGLSGHRIALAIRDLRKNIEDGVLRWSGPSSFRIRPMPRSADFRAVRTKAVALLLARRVEETANAELVSPLDTRASATLSEHGRSALSQVVPRRLVTRDSFSSIGNRFLCTPSDAVELRRRLLLDKLEPDECAAHVVSDAALFSARDGDWDKFIAVRLKDMARLEQSFVDALLARHSSLTAG